MKYENCFEAVADVVAAKSPDGLVNNIEAIAQYCAMVDDLSKDAWSEELAVITGHSESIVVSVKCVGISTSDKNHPLFALMQKSESTSFTSDPDGDVWVHFETPKFWIE